MRLKIYLFRNTYHYKKHSQIPGLQKMKKPAILISIAGFFSLNEPAVPTHHPFAELVYYLAIICFQT